MKQFLTAARRGESTLPNPVDIPFEYEMREGEMVEITAHPPTSGQMALFLLSQSDGGVGLMRALFDFLAAVLDDKDYAVIEESLHQGVDVMVPIELVRYLIEEWSARPTPLPPASPPSPRNTGRRSTAKRPAVVSTSSNSH